MKIHNNNSVSISFSTAGHFIKILRMPSYIAGQNLFHTLNHLLARWTSEHKKEDWTAEKWGNLMFTDEFTFTIRPIKNWFRV